MHLDELREKSSAELLNLAQSLEIDNSLDVKQKDLKVAILKKQSELQDITVSGRVVEILPDGFAFLRSADANYLSSSDDIYVSAHIVKTMHLKTGDVIDGVIVPPKDNEKYFSLLKITKMNFEDPSSFRQRILFDKLTPLFPTKKLQLESPVTPSAIAKDVTVRLIEMVAPIGFGQRALLVSSPRSGKTVMLQTLAKAVMHHHPEVHLIVLLIDERPEEVTEMQRTVKFGEVISSTFDEPAIRHIQVAEMVVEKAKRLVESKKDVVIFLDSITRLARAYNTVMPSSGKVLTGGVDSGALQKPKRIFGAARNIEEGGSLTIIATALVDTGSRMDEVIFEEFKGTGNCEIILDRKLADKRTFPAIDINRSGTRREELLIEPAILQKLWVLRHVLSSMGSVEATDFILEKLRQTKTNSDFFDMMNRL